MFTILSNLHPITIIELSTALFTIQFISNLYIKSLLYIQLLIAFNIMTWVTESLQILFATSRQYQTGISNIECTHQCHINHFQLIHYKVSSLVIVC